MHHHPQLSMHRSLLLGWFLVFSCLSCETNFTLAGPWKDIPVVYGWLSLQDEDHYIRVEKAFLEPGGNAEDIAQIPDSLYYDPSVQVFLEKVNSGQRYVLERIDGQERGLVREDGPFATSPNILYTIPAETIQLRGGERIRLLIDRGAGLDPVTGETRILDDLVLRENNPVSPVHMSYDRQVTFVWNVGEAARIFNVQLIIRYRETDSRNGSSEEKELSWVLSDDLVRTEDAARVSLSIMGEEFYAFLGDNLDANPALQRDFLGMDFQVIAGGEEFLEIKTISEANSGLTSAQAIPFYTNLSEGRGIFSSRSTAVRPGLQLTGLSLDSLREGRYTRNLGF